jgi:Ni/Co efflux regulator RcnB
MRNLMLSGLALALALVPAAAMAGDDSGGMRGQMGRAVMGHMPQPGMGHMPQPGMGHMPQPGMGHMPRPNWGGMHQGRWVGGHNAPGGWNAYRRPTRGFILPSYWIQPSFYVGNYANYGFAQPQYGYGWSRYYNDAVMTDRYGRVYDSVDNVDWDGRGGRASDIVAYGDDYRDSYGYDEREARRDGRGRDRDRGLGGALIGGAVGAVAGNIIGGRGNRLAGSLIGGGVGAIAGAAIDSGDRAGRGSTGRDYDRRGGSNGRVVDYGYDYDVPDDNVTYRGNWNGTWTGSYDGGPERVYNGSYNGEYEGRGPHWARRDDDDRGGARTLPPRGPYVYPHQQMVYPAPTTTTVYIQSAPVVTTTTTTTEYVTEYASVRKRVYRPAARKVWRPKVVRCVCR